MPTMHMARDATDVTDGEWMEAGGRPEATRRRPRCCCCIRHTALNPWPWRPSFDQTITHHNIIASHKYGFGRKDPEYVFWRVNILPFSYQISPKLTSQFFLSFPNSLFVCLKNIAFRRVRKNASHSFAFIAHITQYSC